MVRGACAAGAGRSGAPAAPRRPEAARRDRRRRPPSPTPGPWACPGGRDVGRAPRRPSCPIASPGHRVHLVIGGMACWAHTGEPAGYESPARTTRIGTTGRIDRTTPVQQGARCDPTGEAARSCDEWELTAAVSASFLRSGMRVMLGVPWSCPYGTGGHHAGTPARPATRRPRRGAPAAQACRRQARACQPDPACPHRHRQLGRRRRGRTRPAAGCHSKTVYKWLHRFNDAQGLDGLADLPRPGVPGASASISAAGSSPWPAPSHLAGCTRAARACRHPTSPRRRRPGRWTP
jgi:hypothetical protein